MFIQYLTTKTKQLNVSGYACTVYTYVCSKALERLLGCSLTVKILAFTIKPLIYKVSNIPC